MDKQIVCQGSVDDDSTTGNGDRDNDLPVEELRGGHVAEDEMGPVDSDYFDGFPGDYNGRKRELVGRRPPFMNSVHGNIPEGDRIVPFPPEASLQYRPDSRGPTAVYPSENIGNPREERYRMFFLMYIILHNLSNGIRVLTAVLLMLLHVQVKGS